MAKSSIKDIKGYASRKKFRSDDEVFFAWFLDELLEEGYVDNWTYEEETFELVESHKVPWKRQMRTKVREEEFTLIQGCTYQPDFKIYWNEKAKGLFYYDAAFDIHKPEGKLPYFYARDGVSRIEIKPSHDFQNKTAQAVIKIKWLLQVKNIYVQVVNPIPKVSKSGGIKPKDALFHALFVPERYFMTDGYTKQRTIRFKKQTLSEWGDIKLQEKQMRKDQSFTTNT